MENHELENLRAEYLENLKEVLDNGLGRLITNMRIRANRSEPLLSQPPEEHSTGKITLIWDDGYAETRKIFQTIRGIGEDRYSSYILEPNPLFDIQNWSKSDIMRFGEWLAMLNAGLKRRSG